MKQYLKRTWKNKLLALLLLVWGMIPIWMDGDATMFALSIMLSIPLWLINYDITKSEERHDK